jgi:NAD(P)-dependent dehydrogenase (short-subunit alcohol dehydrogenase family)
MHLEDKRVLITGGARGLGLGITEALHAAKARVTVFARNAERLAALHERLGVDVVTGDMNDAPLVAATLRSVRPAVVVLNAGTTPPMAPIHTISWEDFSTTWNSDAKAALLWIQEAIRLPLAPGSRVLIGSSGAAVNGSPLSGGHAGAKRMMWLMAHYANGVSAELALGIRFQVVVPRQMIGETDHGRFCASAYATKKGISVDDFLAGFGAKLSPRALGDHIVTLLTDPQLEQGTAFGVKGDAGLTSLDTPALS